MNPIIESIILLSYAPTCLSTKCSFVSRYILALLLLLSNNIALVSMKDNKRFMEIFSLVESNEIYFFICENALPYRKDLLRRIRPQFSLYQFRIQLYSMSSMCRNNLRKKNDYIKRGCKNSL